MKAALLLLMIGGSAAGTAGQAPASPTPSNERLKPGDIVRLWIWREEKMSGDLNVAENGTVPFPRIGNRNVLNVSTDALRDSLIAAYNVYLNNPSIEITFRHRVNILGSVRLPGMYHVDRTMAIQDALALAGGAEREGKPNEVQLFRGDQKIMNARITQRIADLPLESGDQIYVPERSWFSRNTTTIASAVMSGLVSIVIALSINK